MSRKPDTAPVQPPRQTGGAPKDLSETSQEARPDDLGQEGTASHVKPNTSDGGRRRDRGP